MSDEIKPSVDVSKDVARILRSRVLSNLDEMKGRSKDGNTAWSVSLRAITSAKAAELAGDVGAVDWCIKMLSECIAERTINRAVNQITPEQVMASLKGAQGSVKRRGYKAGEQ